MKMSCQSEISNNDVFVKRIKTNKPINGLTLEIFANRFPAANLTLVSFYS